LPQGSKDQRLLKILVDYFKGRPNKEFAYEPCALEIAKFMDPNIVEWEMTRFTVDGGRDAVGKYRIGQGAAQSMLNMHWKQNVKSHLLAAA